MMDGIPLILAEEGLEEDPKGIENDFFYRNNVHGASMKIRLGFLRKVYSLLFIQLLVTTVVGFIFMFWPEVRFYIHHNDWLLSLSFILAVVTLIALHFKRKETPINFILLGIFTIVEALVVGVVVTFYDKFIVLQALLLTVAVVGGLTAFTFQTKRDFSNLGTFLFVGLCLLIFSGFCHIFFNTTQLELVISLFGACLFCLFIVYDTQDLMKRVSPEEYILATINLYLDIINLFIYILRILEAMRKH